MSLILFSLIIFLTIYLSKKLTDGSCLKLKKNNQENKK